MVVDSRPLSNRLGIELRTLSIIAAMLIAATAQAADLPFVPEGRPPLRVLGREPVRPRPAAVLTEQVFVEPPRFDIYGYPVRGPVSTVPDPLYASTGCPAALQPAYDAVGNFAGYAAMQMCR